MLTAVLALYVADELTRTPRSVLARCLAER